MRMICLVLLLFSSPLWALDFASSNQRTTVVELYTSEGCSSCPPADHWVHHYEMIPEFLKACCR